LQLFKNSYFFHFFCEVNPVNHDSVLKMVKEKDHDMVLAKNAKIQVEQLMNGDEESPIRRLFGPVGLLVGQRRSSGGDLVVFLARTPNSDAEPAPPPGVPAPPQDDHGPLKSAEDVLSDLPWLEEHVKQVTRMLPGGLEVLGLAIVDPGSEGGIVKKQNVEKILQFANAVHAKTSFRADEESPLYYHVMTIGGTEKESITVYKYDAPGKAWKSGAGASGTKLFETSYESAVPWQVVKSKFLLDYPAFFDPSMGGKGSDATGNFAEKIQTTLVKIKKSVGDSVVLFDQDYKPMARGEVLNPAAATAFKAQVKAAAEAAGSGKKGKGGKGKGKGKGKHHHSRNQDDEEDNEEEEGTEDKPGCIKRVFTADILLDEVDEDEDDDEKDVEAVVSEAGSRLRLSGRMALRVFLHPEATVLEAVEAIKEDIMRTVKARLEIHTDSLVGENGEAKWQEQANVPVVHEPPRRCQIAFPMFRKVKGAGAGGSDGDEDEDEDLDEDFNEDEAEAENESDAAFLRSGRAMVSDFLLPGETPYEAVDSVREVFGFYPSIDTMDDDLEMVASPQQMAQQAGGAQPKAKGPPGAAGPGGRPGAPPSTEAEAAAMRAARHKKFNMIAFLLSAIVVIIGVFISYHTISAPADNPEKLAEEIAKAFNGGAAGGKQGGPGGPTPGGDVPHPPHDEH